MRCETCQALLVDFVSGELSGSTLASATTHIASCSRCQRDVQGLREALDAATLLPMLEPPESVRAHVREAAARAHAQPAGGDLGKKRGAGPSWWWRVLSRFGELATSPQVAMATVLLLMIAVGTYYLPANEETPQAALSPLDPDALEAEKSQAPAATATALPDSNEAAEGRDTEEEATLAPQEPEGEGLEPRKRKAAVADRAASKGAAPFGKAQKQSRSPKATARKAEVPLREAPAAPTREKPRTAPAPFPALAAESDDRADVNGDQAARLESAVGGASAGRGASTSVIPQTPLAQAQAAFDAKHYAEAARLSETALETKGVDAAMAHWIAARSFRATGDCRRALPHYTILRSTTQRFPRAWIDGAVCLHKLGDTAAANTWLGEAEQMPAIRAEAQRVRARLNGEAL